MKKILKKVIAVFMVVIMAVVCVPVVDMDGMFSIEASALTGSGSMGGNVKWKYDTSSKTLTISGSGNMSNYTSTPGDFTKYQAALVCYINKNVTSIVISNGVTNIGNYAFADLTKVTSVTIAGSVTSIGSNAFKGCTALSSVTISSGVKTIGERAFYGCTSLKSITIPGSVTTLSKSAFEGCTSLSSVKLNSGLTSIGEYCFKNTKFANISVPATVTSIGDYAFSGISNPVFTCAYGDTAHNYCKKNSYKYKFTAPIMIIEHSFDTDEMTVDVVLKLLYDSTSGAAINAGNFTFTYNDSVIVVAPDSGYEYTDNAGVSKAVVYGDNKVSVAVMAESAASYTTEGYETYYTLAELSFKVNGQSDTADLTLTADTLMLNGSKQSAAAADVSINLHKYDAATITKYATCCEKGSMYYTCTLCQKKVVEDIDLNTSNHSGGTELVNVITETCGTAGYTGDTYCLGCGNLISEGKDIPATGNHSYSSAVTTTATCSATGVKAYTCSVCGDDYTETVDKDASNHSGSDVVKDVKTATCGADGYTGDTYCSDCGVKTATGTVIKATGEHKTEVRNAVAATCDTDGYTGDTYCTECNEMIEAGSVIKAADGHAYESEAVTVAGCLTDGEVRYTCSVCGDTYTEIVSATGHSYAATVTQPTCTSAGYTVYTCSVCSASYRGDNVASLGHDFDENGKCTRCDEVSVTSIAFKDENITVDNETMTVVSKKANVKVADLLALVDGEGWIVTDAQGNAVADDKLAYTGCMIRHASGTAEYTYVILGDVSMDGKVTAADARLVLRASANLQTMDQIQKIAADADRNDKVSASDARMILRVSAGIATF